MVKIFGNSRTDRELSHTSGGNSRGRLGWIGRFERKAGSRDQWKSKTVSPRGTTMTRLAKFAGPIAILAAVSFASAPAKAQFGGMDESQMQQFAPMLEMIKQKMGKRRFGQMMQMMG